MRLAYASSLVERSSFSVSRKKDQAASNIVIGTKIPLVGGSELKARLFAEKLIQDLSDVPLLRRCRKMEDCQSKGKSRNFLVGLRTQSRPQETSRSLSSFRALKSTATIPTIPMSCSTLSTQQHSTAQHLQADVNRAVRSAAS
ncbi:hypothetical protein BTUL_0260g00050 [Botrytis tulipae]|uniref:Uncharacterized protein n=1 Tax=Botrytis tulipae TaxID=87230 RepID=A0A4Z1E658_9HELO|nr:hypothetical protein BTUL_0260g00050 [Botrytis tulipae]